MNGNGSAGNYAKMAAEIVQQALAAGATEAECTISEGDEFSANVRLREVETLKEAGSRGAGLRILRGRHTGSAYTSDLSGDGIRQMVRSAIELSATQRRQLADALAASYGHQVHLNVVIDPSVVGGISVRIGDELIDGTVASRLAAVRRKLAS